MVDFLNVIRERRLQRQIDEMLAVNRQMRIIFSANCKRFNWAELGWMGLTGDQGSYDQ